MILTDVDFSLLVGALLVVLIATNWRSRLWVGVAALSYINATIAWRMELPYAEAITGMGDAGVCLAVYFAGRYRWEMWIWRLYQASVAISLIYLAANLHVLPLRIDHVWYSVLLELINWILLLLVGGISAAQRIGARNVGAMRPWRYVLRLDLALRQKRAADAFIYRKR